MNSTTNSSVAMKVSLGFAEDKLKLLLGDFICVSGAYMQVLFLGTELASAFFIASPWFS